MILAITAIIAHRTHSVCNFFIVRHNTAAITQCTQIFSRIEAKRGRVTKSSNSASFITSSMRLSSVFHQFQMVAFCNFHNGIHIGRTSLQVYSNNRFGPFCNFLLNPCRVDVVSFQDWLHKNRACATVAHSQRCCNKRIARHNYFIAFSNAKGTQN